MEQCQTMPTNRTILTLVTSNSNLSQLPEQSQPDSLLEQRQAESPVEQCNVKLSQLAEQWQTKHILPLRCILNRLLGAQRCEVHAVSQ